MEKDVPILPLADSLGDLSIIPGMETIPTNDYLRMSDPVKPWTQDLERIRRFHAARLRSATSEIGLGCDLLGTSFPFEVGSLVLPRSFRPPRALNLLDDLESAILSFWTGLGLSHIVRDAVALSSLSRTLNRWSWSRQNTTLKLVSNLLSAFVSAQSVLWADNATAHKMVAEFTTSLKLSLTP